MNILLVTDFDNGGQMVALWKALNRYSEHKARLITFRRTFLAYEEDVFNPPPAQVEELCAWADFFILGEILYPNIQSEPVYKKIRADNCIIRAAGSVARYQPGLYNSPIMKAGGFHDPTLGLRVFPMAPTVNMYHFEEWPVCDKKWEPPFKLVFSGTPQKHRAEHCASIKEAWDALSELYGSDMIEFVNISMLPWQESLRIKSQGHICYDQGLLGTYANSAVEGMWYCMPTFCYISGWSGAVFPDAPVISFKKTEDIVNHTVGLIENPREMYDLGMRGHDYVTKAHSAKEALKRWRHLIRFVSEEYKGPLTCAPGALKEEKKI